MTLVYLTLAWIAGILLAHTLWSLGLIGCTTPGWPFGALAGCAVLTAIFLRHRPAVRLAAILLAFQHPGRMALCGSPLCRLSFPG